MLQLERNVQFNCASCKRTILANNFIMVEILILACKTSRIIYIEYIIILLNITKGNYVFYRGT